MSAVSLQQAVPARVPTSPEILNFLANRTGGEMVQLLQSMRDPSAQAALTAALLFSPAPSTSRATAPEKVSVKNAEKSKKALNAFVGFRCYYIDIPDFKPWPMKKLSGPMGALWEADPNKSVWSLLAKAWSTMRDQIGKDNVPLNQFFHIICRRLEIPSPEAYIAELGWKFFVNENGDPAVVRDPSYTPGPSAVVVATAALSVEDVISYCQSEGYAQQYVFDQNVTSSTFLGHSAGMTSARFPTNQLYIASMQKRLAEKKRRRVKRQAGRENGFAEKFQEQMDRAHALDGFDFSEVDNGRYIACNDERDVAGDMFYEDLTSLLDGHTMPANDAATGNSDDIDYDVGLQFMTGVEIPQEMPNNNYDELSREFVDLQQGSGYNNGEDVATPVDMSAFVLGANNSATLPSFDYN